MFYPRDIEMYREVRLYCGSEKCLISQVGKAPRPRKHTVGFLVYDTGDRAVYPTEADRYYTWSFRESLNNRPGTKEVETLTCPECGVSTMLMRMESRLCERFLERHPEQKKTSLAFLRSKHLAASVSPNSDLWMPRSEEELKEYSEEVERDVRNRLINEIEDANNREWTSDGWLYSSSPVDLSDFR